MDKLMNAFISHGLFVESNDFIYVDWKTYCRYPKVCVMDVLNSSKVTLLRVIETIIEEVTSYWKELGACK